MSNPAIILKNSQKYDGIKKSAKDLIKKIIDQKNIDGEMKQDDIKIFYRNIDQLSDIIVNLKSNKSFSSVNTEKKEEIIKLCETEINTEIQYIIVSSYICFMNNKNSKKDFKTIFIDIQKSKFYSEIKNDIKIKKMEDYVKIYEITNKVSKDKNYSECYKNLLNIEKSIDDYDIRNEIEGCLKICKKGIFNNKIIESKKCMKDNMPEYAAKIIEDLIKEFNNESELSEEILDVKSDYLFVLEELIEKKIRQGKKNIDEIKKYDDFIKKYEYDFDNIDLYKETLDNFKKRLNNKKIIKKDLISRNNFDINIPINGSLKIDNNKIEEYLNEIEKLFPKKERNIFKKCKAYIINQIYNFKDEEKNNYYKTTLWIKNRYSHQKELKDIKNIGRIYSYLNHINRDIIKYDIYIIQLISLLILSKEKSPNIKGIFCKINTGEGKSTIIQFLAAYKVLLGKKVDIVTSTQDLAYRDATYEERVEFYKKLDMTVGYVPNEDKSYNFDIIYGETNQFSADIILNEFKFISTRGHRGFDVIIIDEVDNMCIDNLSTRTQLTTQFPGYQSLFTFYYIIIYVFNFIAFDMKLTNDELDLEKKRPIIKEAVLQKLKGNYTQLKEYQNEKDVLEEIDTFLDEEKKMLEAIKTNNEEMINKLNREKIERNKEKKNGNKIQKILTEKGKIFEVDGKNVVGILYPNCMKKEIEDNIEKWIDSVITSFSMMENINFRIKQYKEKGYKRIVPVDFINTGATQGNMVWREALHQILQIINDVEVFPEKINTNFLLIISFFQKYKELYGVTGTIGSKTNQETLKRLYDVELYFIPPNLKSKLKKINELFFSDINIWESTIIKEIKSMIKENRSVLLICRSIKMAEKFEEKIRNSGIKNIKRFFTEENKHIEKEMVNSKSVIIATNFAGRGTDFKISSELEKVGGLHVIVSFLPLNQRIEEQNYGRAGRNGQNGSYSLLFFYESAKNNPLLTIETIKKNREIQEKNDIDYFYEKQLKIYRKEEELYNDYVEYRNKILKKCDDEFIKEDNEYQWGIIFNSNESFSIKKQKLAALKKKELIPENISNPLIKIKYFIANIRYFGKKDENIFQEEKYYSWGLKMKYATYLAIKDKSKKENIEKAIKYYNEVIDILKEFQIDLKNQSVIYKFIFNSFKKNEEIIKNNPDKLETRIDAQNERKKKILQAIIDIIQDNVNKLESFQKTDINYIDVNETYSIYQICINNLKLKNKDEIEDLESFISEFGTTHIDTLRIINKPNMWKNYLVFFFGAVEVIVGALIIGYLGESKFMRDLGIFLIRQGFEDMILAITKALEGKEIDLKKWGEEKAIGYIKGIISIALGGMKFGKVLSFKNEIFKIAGEYAIQKTAEYGFKKLINDSSNQIQELCTEKITKPILQEMNMENEPYTRLIVMDMINKDKRFENHIINKTELIFKDVILEIKNTFSEFKKLKNILSKGLSTKTVIHALLVLGPLIYKWYELIKNKIIYENNKKLDELKEIKQYNFFDGSLESLIRMGFSSFDENSEKKVKQICIKLIQYNVINKEGLIDIKQINNKNLDQYYLLKINKEFKNIEQITETNLIESSKLLGLEFKEKQEYIQYIKQMSFYFDKNKIEQKRLEIYKNITKIVLSSTKIIVDILVGVLVNKFNKYIEKKQELEDKKRKEQTQKVISDFVKAFEIPKTKQTQNGKNQKKPKENEENKINNRRCNNKEEKDIKITGKQFIENIKSKKPLIGITKNITNKKKENKPNKRVKKKELDLNIKSNPIEENYEYKSINILPFYNNIPEEPHEVSEAYNEYKRTHPNETKNDSLIIDNDNIENSNNLNHKSNNIYNKKCGVEYYGSNYDEEPEACELFFGKDDFDKININNIDKILINNNNIDNKLINNNIDNILINNNNIDNKMINNNNIDNILISNNNIDNILNNNNDNILNNNNNQNNKLDININNINNINNDDDNKFKNISSLMNNINEIKEEKVENNNKNISDIINDTENKNTNSSSLNEENKNNPLTNKKFSNNTKNITNHVDTKSNNNNNIKVISTIIPIVPMILGNNNPNNSKKSINNKDKLLTEKIFDLEKYIDKMDDLFEKLKDKFKSINWLEVASLGIDVYETVRNFMKERNIKDNRIDLDKLDKKYLNEFLERKLSDERKKKEEKERKKKEKEEKINLCKNEWKEEKNKIIDSLLNDINYLDLIEKIFNENFIEFKIKFEEKILLILNSDNESYNLLIKQKHEFIFNKIKNKIPKVETLNFMLLGFTGAGKSCLVNALLLKDLAKEYSGIKTGTQEFSRYENPKAVPGIALYDTIGVEPTNASKNLKEIKEIVKKTFEDNLQDSNKSLHGIIYCIKHGSDANRIEEGEINFIKELNSIYGNSNILTIVLTQVLSKNSKHNLERMNQIREELNNKNIEIIPVRAKEEKIEICDKKNTVKQIGLIELKNTMIKNSKKIISANLKYAAKVKIKEEYCSIIKNQYNLMIKKIKKEEFQNTFSAEFEKILRNLLIFEKSEKFDIKFNLEDLDKNISELIEKLNIKIMKNLMKKNKRKCMDKLKDSFIILNGKYNNAIKFDDWMEEYFFKIKFEEYFKKIINDEIHKIVFTKASIFFMKKCKELLEENISKNITDEEIGDLVDKNTENILKKILKKK